MDRITKTLIVDDSKAICYLLRDMLQHFGIAIVEVCHDGEAAIELLEQSSSDFDAVFVDLHMEGMDGLELMHRLHKMHYRGGVVIISSLDKRIVDYTMEVVSNYSIRLLGSIEKPIERSIVAFMARRILSAKKSIVEIDKLPKRREILEALNENLLRAYFQPVIDGDTNSIHALECLSRLELSGYGPMSPREFMPVVERFDLLDIFTEKLFTVAAPAYRYLLENTDIRCPLNINLSPKQLYSDELPETLATYAAKFDLANESLCLEITEDYSLTEEPQQKNLSRLGINGFKLSLDDYGAGYTNLYQVTNMPFDSIKLDAELINGMHKDKVLRIIVESVHRITQELDIDLIAEGIADADDLMSLNQIGIRYFQGYFFARPKPANELVRWYNNWNKTLEQSRDRDKQIIEKRKRKRS